ncbi:MAG TPA: dihydrofolate reductase [Pricia antarctica]|uniref:Dihydrofolate reductase n=2 Tax=root TaxID=1 RepID=A0A831QST2_9FLAO|nr:dihydrofolate reductase [Pricia antarctica]
MIAAAGENNALAKDGDLPWHLPDDFKRFKKLTSGHAIIMGRKTFDGFDKPLPNRKHIIITRDKKYTTDFEGCTVVHSLEDALEMVKDDSLSFIIGGGEIYKQGQEFANKIELTRIHNSFEGADTFFPEIDLSNWELVTEEFHPEDNRHAFSFTYLTYARS